MSRLQQNLLPKEELPDLIQKKNWLRYFKDFNLALQIFRLSGIYSNENNALIRLKKRKLNIIEKKISFFQEFI